MVPPGRHAGPHGGGHRGQPAVLARPRGVHPHSRECPASKGLWTPFRGQRMQGGEAASEAAMQALPRVADIMAEELGWNKKVKAVQIEAAKAYLESYGGRIPVEDDLHVRLPTLTEAMDIFKEIDTDGSGFLDKQEIKEMAIRLGQPLPDDRIDSIFATMDKNKDGRVQADEFMEWFGKEETMAGMKAYFHKKTLQIFEEIDIDGSNDIDEQELMDISLRLGQGFDKKTIKKIFKEMDTNRDGKIQIEEFIAWMDKENDETGFRKMLASSLGLGGTGWLDQKSGSSFLG